MIKPVTPDEVVKARAQATSRYHYQWYEVDPATADRTEIGASFEDGGVVIEVTCGGRPLRWFVLTSRVEGG